MGRRIVGIVLGAVVVLTASPAVADEPAVVQVVEAPKVTGTARYAQTLSVAAGSYDPATATESVQWLRDGSPIAGATGRTRTLTNKDVAHRLSARVTVSAPDRTATVVTTGAVTVRGATLTYTRKPSVSGTRRYGRTLTAHPGLWKGGTPTIRYQWVRDGRPISGATGKTYALRVADPGHRVTVRVTASRRYHETRTVKIASPGVTRHRRDIRKVVTYSVVADGVPASRLAVVRRSLVETYQDARGWRASGVKLVRVARGGSFTVVLAAPSRVPRYSPVCSTRFSCRVGRHVILNDARWRGATRTWRAAHRSLRDYRHMVVNHETGHWFGKNHAGCSTRGSLAPVMMQQSKGLAGCTPNPWPKLSELGLPRFGWRP